MHLLLYGLAPVMGNVAKAEQWAREVRWEARRLREGG
jgi:hypothetical protein